jgi:hypothetical protein
MRFLFPDSQGTRGKTENLPSRRGQGGQQGENEISHVQERRIKTVGAKDSGLAASREEGKWREAVSSGLGRPDVLQAA